MMGSGVRVPASASSGRGSCCKVAGSAESASWRHHNHSSRASDGVRTEASASMVAFSGQFRRMTVDPRPSPGQRTVQIGTRVAHAVDLRSGCRSSPAIAEPLGTRICWPTHASASGGIRTTSRRHMVPTPRRAILGRLFLYYRPDARWRKEPPAPDAGGSTIIGFTSELEHALSTAFRACRLSRAGRRPAPPVCRRGTVARSSAAVTRCGSRAYLSRLTSTEIFPSRARCCPARMP
jgi:hypothetical protein